MQEVFEYFSAIVTSIFEKISHAIALIINIHTPQEASLVAQMVKNLPANARDLGSIPQSGRSCGEGNGNPLQ